MEVLPAGFSLCCGFFAAMERTISTEEGILLRVNRSIRSEGVFAMMKEDMNFWRFLTRWNSNVMVGMVSCEHGR